MARIICDKCKNDSLQNNGEALVCPSCGAEFSADDENLLFGIQCYYDGNFEEGCDALMKALVKNGTDYRAMLYKGLCDAAVFDEDTLSLADSYKKLEYALAYVPDEELPAVLEKANNEAEKIEKALTELHVKAFETADAEKIKREVASILKIRDEALAFRTALYKFADAYNERCDRKIIARFSKCFYVEPSLATEVGDAKFGKITDDIATHTVFTGILSSDIKNAEIYYRCVVMFFEKSKDKYNFLLDNSKKFLSLTELLKEGNYNSVTGTDETAEKLKLAAYTFFEDSLKEHDDEFTAAEQPVIEFEPLPETPVEEATVEEAPVEEAPVEEAPVEEAPVEEAPVEEAPVEEAPVEEAPVEEAPVEEAPVEEAPVEEAPVEEAPVEEAPVEEAPVEEAPVEEAPVEEAPVEEAPVEETPAEETPAEETPVEETPAEEKSSESEKNTDGEAQNAAVETIEFRDKSTVGSSSDSKDESAAEEETVVFDPAEIFPSQTAEQTDDKTREFPKNEVKLSDEESTAAEEEKEEEEYKPTYRKRKKKKHIPLILFILILAAGAVFAGWKYIPGIINDKKYEAAAALEEQKDYNAAAQAYKALDDYKDSAEKVLECSYMNAAALEEKGEYEKAAAAYTALEEYKDSTTRVNACRYELAKAALDAKDFDGAKQQFTDLADYGNSADMAKECDYLKADGLITDKKYTEALDLLKSIKGYSDSKEKIKEVKYLFATENLGTKDKKLAKTVKAYLKELAEAKFRNSAELYDELLGEEISEVVSLFINTSKTDLSEKLTSVPHSQRMYFHIKANSKSLYGKTVTLAYTTQYNYTYKKTVTLSEGSPDGYLEYPSTSLGNYTVTFSAYLSDGTKLGDSITIKVS